MCGTAMPQVNSEANTPPGTPAWCSSSQTITASAPSPPPPPTSSGKFEPSRPASPAARCNSRGSSPLRSHSSTFGKISRSANERTVLRSASRSGVVQMLTTTLLTATLLECRRGGCAATRRVPWPAGSNRAWYATPWPRISSMTKFIARRLGSRCRVTGRSAVFRQQLAKQFDGQRVGQPAPLLVGADPDPDVGRPALVAAAGTGDAAQRYPCVGPSANGSGNDGPAAGASSRVSVAQAIAIRVPSAWTAVCATSAAST